MKLMQEFLHLAKKKKYSEFTDIIDDCPNMKNIFRELLPTFLYF